MASSYDGGGGSTALIQKQRSFMIQTIQHMSYVELVLLTRLICI